MAYRVELTVRASRNLDRIFFQISAVDSQQAQAWYNGLQATILSLNENPWRGAIAPERSWLRHLLYGSHRYVYRVIYSIDDATLVVKVLHIRHGSRRALGDDDRM